MAPSLASTIAATVAAPVAASVAGPAEPPKLVILGNGKYKGASKKRALEQEKLDEKFLNLHTYKIAKKEEQNKAQQEFDLKVGGKAVIHCIGKHNPPRHTHFLLRAIVGQRLSEWWAALAKSVKVLLAKSSQNRPFMTLEALHSFELLRRQEFEVGQLGACNLESLKRDLALLEASLLVAGRSADFPSIVQDLYDPDYKPLVDAMASSRAALASLHGKKPRVSAESLVELEVAVDEEKLRLAALKQQEGVYRKEPLPATVHNLPAFQAFSSYFWRLQSDNFKKLQEAIKDSVDSMVGLPTFPPNHPTPTNAAASSGSAGAEPEAVDLD